VIVLGLPVIAVVAFSEAEVAAEANDGNAAEDSAGGARNAGDLASGLGVVDDMGSCVALDEVDRVCSIRPTRWASPGNITSDSKLSRPPADIWLFKRTRSSTKCEWVVAASAAIESLGHEPSFGLVLAANSLHAET
jgi:hypothetical protein